MLQLIQAIPFSFAALFPVLNPLGSALIFLTLTMSLSEQEQARMALKVGVNTFFLLVVVLLTGSWILRLFGITVPIVQLGGGLVVAYIGWRLLNDGDGQTTAYSAGNKNIESMAFYPLTMPITAGPGCIAVTLTIGAHELSRSLPSYTNVMLAEIGAVIGIFLASVVVFLCYRYANRLTAKLGTSGTQVIMKLAAFINLCIGIEIMWHGVRTLAPML